MVLTIIWLLIILFFSVIPVQGLQTEHPADKITHFVFYGITAIIFFRILRTKMPLVKTTIVSIIFASLYGLAMELIQHGLPWRQFSLSDEASNFSGAMVFSVIYAIREYNRKRLKTGVTSIYRKGD
ncbi:MAG TPA: VanZ family protein [Thermodesulfovibrionales bacterium]|nr:VanZ family protein [Thermodesulfovibrionales bacterium]